MSLTADQANALGELRGLWPDRAQVIIGATALGFHYEMTWRKTADVDLVIAIGSDDLPGALVKARGWRAHPHKEHEFISPRGVKLDILPAGAALLAEGSLRWKSGRVMNLVGVDLAFRHAERHEVENVTVDVAPPAVIAVLKMVAFTDRPLERQRDLDDLAHLLDAYVDDTSPRYFDEGMALGAYELVPAYLLGIDIARISAAPHRAAVDGFWQLVADPDEARHALMQQRGPARWRAEADPLQRRLDALRSGLATVAT